MRAACVAARSTEASGSPLGPADELGGRPTGSSLLLVGSADALSRASDLIEAHAAVRAVRTLRIDAGGAPWPAKVEARLAAQRGEFAAVIVLADPAVPVAEVVAGPTIGTGALRVPVGVLPDDPRALRAAAAVQRRETRETGPVVLLSSREEYVNERAERLARTLTGAGLRFRALPTRSTRRTDLMSVLGAGPGLVLYTGVAGPLGWSGYGQPHAWELERPGTQPIPAVISLACSTAARVGSGHGFSEELVQRGAAAGAFGAVSEVLSADNEALGEALSRALIRGARTLAELVLAPPRLPALDLFRIVGDPLAPLAGAPGSWAAVQAVSAPGLRDSLAPVAWSTPETA